MKSKANQIQSRIVTHPPLSLDPHAVYASYDRLRETVREECYTYPLLSLDDYSELVFVSLENNLNSRLPETAVGGRRGPA